MRTFIAALALAVVACSWSKAPAADAGFSDAICPEATQYVLAVGKLRKDDPPQRIYDSTQAATDAYQRCSKDKLSNGFREAQHYADTRGSSFAVLAARALIALNRADEARRELALWRPLAQQVVDWQSETQTSVSGHKPGEEPSPMSGEVGTVTRGDHRRSMYAGSAKEIVAAIDAEIGRIDASLRDRPRTQGHSSPAPEPTAGP
ncbi:MAG TPA: hypothetical protein VN224_05210 [Xanthomonadales bacterium]|nr:hypothetical protein [Xanthomonadales bacterium]